MHPITIDLDDGTDLLKARLAARDLARAAGLGVMDQTRFATAISELCRNSLNHARDGHCELRDLSSAVLIVLQGVVRDQGPGIADIELALGDGYSTSGSLGVGLPGTRRLVDRFQIESSPAGTLVTIQLHRRRRPG